jgi:hypothetical protein
MHFLSHFRRHRGPTLADELAAVEWAVYWGHHDLARALLIAAGRDGRPTWGTSDVELAVLAGEDDRASRLARARLGGIGAAGAT